MRSSFLHRVFAALALLCCVALAACNGAPRGSSSVAGTPPTTSRPATQPSTGTSAPGANVYAHDAAGMLSGRARHAKQLVYVPNTLANTVQVIDPLTYRVVARYRVGREPQHVVPSWDLSTLWVNSDLGNSLTAISPVTGKVTRTVAVDDPYNLYFTPDGRHALVMAERLHRIDVRDPHTMKLERSLHVPCSGLNHADFTADLSRALVSCEFSGQLLVVDADATKVLRVLDLNGIRTKGATSPAAAMRMTGPQAGLQPGATAMPQDVRLSPDGTHFVVADMLRNGVWVVNAKTFAVERFTPTGLGAHSVYPDRSAERLFVANRDAGTVSVLDPSTLKVRTTWRLPGGGSPDMGGVSADGRQLWLSGRYDSVVYVIDTSTGRLLHKIRVDAGPHGLSVWPQPGRFSLGHTGNMR